MDATMTWQAVRPAAADDAAPLAPLDEARFRRLHARLAGPLEGYLQRLTGRPATAQDLAQDTWLKLLSIPVDASDDARLRSFVFCIATNLARDLFRKRRRESLFGLRPVGRHEAEAGAGPGRGPEAGDLDAALGVLSPRDRALVLLAHVEGFEHREIAAALDLRSTSVRVLLFRARRKLARELERRGLAPGGER